MQRDMKEIKIKMKDQRNKKQKQKSVFQNKMRPQKNDKEEKGGRVFWTNRAHFQTFRDTTTVQQTGVSVNVILWGGGGGGGGATTTRVKVAEDKRVS